MTQIRRLTQLPPHRVPANRLDPHQQLQQLADQDEPYIVSNLADHWVPQLSSKLGVPPWSYDSEDGFVYDSALILQDHLRLRQQYDAKLLWSGDWSNYDRPQFLGHDRAGYFQRRRQCAELVRQPQP